MKTNIWKHLSYALTALLLLAPQFLQAQQQSWASLDSQLTAAGQRADSIWYYGVDHAPIVREMEAVQEAACEAGFDDLYVLSFVALSYVYEVLYMEDRYASAVLQGIGEARARLAEDDVARAVAWGRYSHYCWNEVPEKEDSAVVWFNEALAVLEGSRYKKALFWCQLGLAEVELYSTGNYRAAGYYLNKAEKIPFYLGFPSKPLVTLNETKSYLFFVSGDYPKSIDHQTEALNFHKSKHFISRKDSSKISNTLNDLSVLYKKMGQLEKATKSQRKSVDIQIQFSERTRLDSASLSTGFNNLAVLAQFSGQLEEAIQAQKKALKLSLCLSQKTLHDSSEISIQYNNLASQFQSLGDFDQAIQMQMAAIEIIQEQSRKKRSDSTQLAICYNNLGGLYKLVGYLDEAILNGEKAISIGQNISFFNPVQQATQIVNLNAFLEASGQPKKALKGYYQALKLLPTASHLEAAETLYSLYSNLGDLPDYLVPADKALGFLDKAVSLTQKWPINPYLVHSKKGLHLSRKAQFGKALNEYNLALESARDLYSFPNPILGNIHRRIAISALTQGKFEFAYFHSEKAVANLALKSPKLNGFHLDKLQANNLLVNDLYQIALSKYAIAELSINKREVLKEAFQTFLLGDSASIRQRKNSPGKISRLYVSNDALPIYTGTIRTALDLYELEQDSSYLLQAFRSAEKAKGLTLLQSQWEAQAHDQGYLPDTLLQLRSLWLGDLGRLEGRLRGCDLEVGEPFDTVKVNYLETRIFELKEKLSLWRSEVTKHYPDYKNRLEKDFKVQLEPIEELVLEENEALIEYHIGRAERFGPTKIGEDELYTFVVTKEDLKVYRRPLPETLDTTIAILARALSDYRYATDSVAESYASYTQAAFSLYQILLDSVLLDHPNIEKIIVVPHEKLSQVPFEALLTAKAPVEKIDYLSLPYLIQDYQVRYAYSAAQQLEIAQRPPRTSVKGCLAMAPESPNNELLATRGEMATFRGMEKGQLSGAHREVRRLAEKGLPGNFFFGEAATEAAFKEAAAQHAILYLAQHGVADPEDPEESHLIFSPTPSDSSEDGQLHSYELAGLSLGAQLAVLSACETGVGRYLQGEGVASLGRDFIAAGVSSVVMTLWQVEDQASADLMGRFFDNIQTGLPSAEALHRAKIDYLNQADSRSAHPLFWAGYISNGGSESIPLESTGIGAPALASLGVGLGAFGLLLLAAWGRQRRRKRKMKVTA